MTARYLLTLSLILGVGGLAACSTDAGTKGTTLGDDDDDDAVGDAVGDDDDDTVSDTFPPTDTATGGPDEFPGTLSLAYQFGYNQQARTTSEVLLDFGTGPIPIPPSIDVHLGTSSWNGDTSQTTQYCTLSLDMTNAIVDPTFVGSDPRLLVGFLRAETDPVLTDCYDGVEPDLDAAYWGTDFGTYMANYGDFGMAIGEMDSYTDDFIAPLLTATLTPDDLVGGTLRDGFFLSADVPEVYGFAWEIDQSFNVVLDANYYLQAVPYASVDLGNNAAQAWYDMNLLFYYTFQ